MTAYAGFCQHGWPIGHTSVCIYCQNPQLYWPDPQRTTYVQPTSGWQCPGCSSCYGPHVDKCPTCPGTTTVTCTHIEVDVDD